VLGDWFWRTKIGKVAQGPLTDIFFDHVVITDKRVLLYDTSGREAELNSSEIKDADFDWDNGGRVLRLKASAPFNNFVLTRHDLDDVMTILQNQFLLPIPRSL